MPERSDLIYDLERVNQLIDLCIDCELYDYIDDIIGLSEDAHNYIKQLKEPKEEKEEKSLDEFEFPVEKIKIPSGIIGPVNIRSSQLFRSKEPSYALKDMAGTGHLLEPLLKNWSDLFWAKRIRAELLRHNKDTLNRRYDDLVTFLDSRIPINKSAKKQTDFSLTKFNYLMEQSAAAPSEASHGYAERAREALNKLYKNPKDPERGFYDRWISWNKGMAYQHMVGRNQKAVLEFNWVIKEFWYQQPEKDRKQNKEIILHDRVESQRDYFNVVLEFLVNIVPAYLQRAAINLKLQLGYHALQTLFIDDLDKLLKETVKGDSADNIFSRATIHLQKRINLHRIEALLQLDLIDKDNAEKWLKSVHEDIFDNSAWNPDNVTLPLNEEKSSQKAIKTRLVEHTVQWFYQKANRLLSILCDPQNKSKFEKGDCDEETSKEIEQAFTYLIGLIKIFLPAEQGTSSYWDWVKGNNKDELIYFSRWAQLLRLGVEPLHKLQKYNLKSQHDLSQLLTLVVKLYKFQRERLPKIRDDRPSPVNSEETIELENLRSDDRPDFTSGLSAFFEKISGILLGEKCSLRTQAETILKEVSLTKENFKNDHFQVLDALNDYEKEFGQNQQIKILKRYNERLTWEKPEDCKGCLDTNNTKNDSQNPYHFNRLLKCRDKRSGEKSEKDTNTKDDVLYRDDYQNIMRKAESLFLKHLEISSLQKPARNALHFVGLQRWNSLTPAQGRSVGGGYLIYRTDKSGKVDLGIAVDPGFDFVRNLFRMGFSLRDIDIVIISHAHPDHLWDFETMVQLLHELKGKKGITHRLNVIMTLGSYNRLDHIIKNPNLRSFINPLVVDICKEVDPLFWKNINNYPGKYSFNFFDTSIKQKETKLEHNKNNQRLMRWQPVLPLPVDATINKTEIEIQPTWAYHEDYTEVSDSFGFKINVVEPDTRSNSLKFSFGYTGDTKWVGEDLYPVEKWENIASQYEKCDVMLMHIGSLINHKKGGGFEQYTKSNGGCAKLIRKENHPYLMGIIRFLKKLGYPEIEPTCKNQKLILLGEFGEELRGGIRTDIVKRLQGMKNRKWPILPVDVGFDVLLYDYNGINQESGDGFKFLCALCDEHSPIEEIDYFRFGQDEAIFYICKTCIKATPVDVRQTRLRQLYDIGRELRTLPPKAR